jgi:hypothetical protein
LQLTNAARTLSQRILTVENINILTMHNAKIPYQKGKQLD